jgi:uncharacterized protein YgiM (DUF1202 family)
VPRTLIAFIITLLVVVLAPGLSAAQTTTEPTVYAVTELNLRKGPSIDDAVLAFVPLGAGVQRAPGQETNAYAPVTYNGVMGWVVALGLVASPDLVDTVETVPAPAPILEPAPEAISSPLASGDARVTLEPLMLRDGPAVDAEVLAGMPQGSLVTLTREGAENGYVTVDYGGLLGWAYADLLGEDLASA